MKQGNQFYLDFQIEDETGKTIDINSVQKVQFVIGDLIKIYDGENNEITYENGTFKVWLTEEETFLFNDEIKMDARILFKNNSIGGTYVETGFWYDSLKEVALDV
mgnify:CR=1 FL=1